MSYLRRVVKRALPSPLLYTARDFKYVESPTASHAGRQGINGINIIRSHFYPKRTILFLPERPLPERSPSRGSLAYKLCRLLGYGITTHALHRYEKTTRRRYDVVFKYDRTTFSAPLSSRQFRVEHVINGDSTDISKRAVNDAFEDIFGYALGVDPTTYRGAIVVKSNMNSAHDGYVVDGPIAAADVRAENAYQRAVDNTVPDQDLVLDCRVPIYGEHIPLVYLKYRPTESRFANKNVRVVTRKPAEVFSNDEIDKIHLFARRMGIDYAEFDVLRDKDDRIYVVDANTAPWGPPNGLETSDRKRALARLASSFDALIRKYAVR